MSDKLNFAKTINELNGMPPMSECMNFGMTWGCREDCPVFERGECKIQKENEEFFNQQGDG